MDLCFWKVITMWTNFLWKNCYPTNYGKFPGKYQILGNSWKLQGCNVDKIGQNFVAYVCLKISKLLKTCTDVYLGTCLTSMMEHFGEKK